MSTLQSTRDSYAKIPALHSQLAGLDAQIKEIRDRISSRQTSALRLANAAKSLLRKTELAAELEEKMEKQREWISEARRELVEMGAKHSQVFDKIAEMRALTEQLNIANTAQPAQAQATVVEQVQVAPQNGTPGANLQLPSAAPVPPAPQANSGQVWPESRLSQIIEVRKAFLPQTFISQLNGISESVIAAKLHSSKISDAYHNGTLAMTQFLQQNAQFLMPVVLQAIQEVQGAMQNLAMQGVTVVPPVVTVSSLPSPTPPVQLATQPVVQASPKDPDDIDDAEVRRALQQSAQVLAAAAQNAPDKEAEASQGVAPARSPSAQARYDPYAPVFAKSPIQVDN